MIAKEILKDDLVNKRKVRDMSTPKQVEWIRENCCIEGEETEETERQYFLIVMILTI